VISRRQDRDGIPDLRDAGRRRHARRERSSSSAAADSVRHRRCRYRDSHRMFARTTGSIAPARRNSHPACPQAIAVIPNTPAVRPQAGVVAEEELAVVAAEEEGEPVQIGVERVRAVGGAADEVEP
jgi:hypothetical protein